jgi:hypothetical protein
VRITDADLRDAPERLAVLLSQFDTARGRREDRGFVLPHPGRVDRNPSVWVTVTEDRILVCDRTGGPTDDVLDAVGWEWRDLYARGPGEKAELADYAARLEGGATAGAGESKVEVEGLDFRHEVYAAALDLLPLSDAHAAYAAQRGIPRDEARRRGYRTLTYSGRARLTAALLPRYAGGLLNVPGWRSAGGRVEMVAASGLVVPVRTLEGKLAALKVRQDHAAPRWLYLAGGGGPAARNMPHFPLGLPPACERLWVTESEGKADAAAVRGLPAIGVPGAGMWKVCLPYLRDLGARTVVIALDRSADPDRQAKITATADEFAEALDRAGFDVEEQHWDVT